MTEEGQGEEGGENKVNRIVCNYCGKEFDSTDEFMIHIDQVHSSSDSFR